MAPLCLRIAVMETFSLGGRPYVTLSNLLKLLGWSESGGAAKHLISDGEVMVDGQPEARKKCKLVAGQVVSCNGQQVQIIA